ncbi:histone-lysine N-methyltransferase SETMAR [Leptopilina heterotoma]|uniref:histone-lysine N-methyltransferase SETMAR n=1 Tax=Leptopilina heterotoma TaxID=63436 RepID=UPI001CA848B7|nr:histone-lysine N-methyltransferase SETMAR [Leptopilina heterotoma]
MDAKNCEDEYTHPTADLIYTERNIPGPGVDGAEFESEFVVGCACEAQCSSGDCSCTLGKPNYENDRLVEDKVGPTVECNSHCLCGETCGNRLVQRGPLGCLNVVEAQGRGLGLSTSRLIRKGQFICEYAGEVVGLEEAKKRLERNGRGDNYVLVVNEHVGGKTITTCIDPRFIGNVGRFCNHSCEANSRLVPVRVEKASPRVALFARRDIEPGEEVTFNYADGVETSVHNISETPCLCGSSTCLRYLPHHSV